MIEVFYRHRTLRKQCAMEEGSAFSLYMGVDVGTTKIAVILLDFDSGTIVATHNAVNSSEVTDAEGKARGWSEWDADEAVELTFKAMAEVPSFCSPHRVKGIGVTGQMHGMVLVSRNRRPLSPFIGWQDQRCNENVPGTGASYIERMIRLVGDQGFSREGCHPATGYMGSSLFWLKEKCALPSQAATACFLPDYLAMRMTGVGPVTDSTNAGGSGIYDVVSREWDADLIERLGLRSDMLPEVRKSGESIGGLTDEAAKRTGLEERTPVCVACGDNQASFLGSVGSRRDTALINIGTGGQISLWVPKYLAVKGVDTRCYFDESYLLVGAGLCGGRSYSALNGFFKEVGRVFFGVKDDEELYDRMNRLASEVPPGSDGLVCEPFFTGTRLDPDLRGTWRGMSESNFTAGHMTRALLEGIARTFMILYAAMLQEGVSLRECLAGSGNAIRRNPLLTEILSDTFSMPVMIPGHGEEAAFGAALLAALGCGEFKDIEEAARLVRYE